MANANTRADVMSSLLRHGTEGDGAIRSNEYNLLRILALDPDWTGRLYFDQLAQETILDGTRLSDEQVTMMAAWVTKHYAVDFSRDKLWHCAQYVASRKPVHPVATYLHSLDWDGRPRMRRWLSTYMGAPDDALTRAYGLRWLLSACWRALRPGCQADSALVFFSATQGLKKSTSIRALASEAWFGDAPIRIGDATPQGQAVLGKWIYELGELASLRKADIEAVKGFLTTQVDDYRAPYARAPRKIPRSTVFIATTNNELILSDPTGSRRLWPVAVGSDHPIDREGLQRDRDQIFAEAMAWLKRGCGSDHGLHTALELDADAFRAWSAELPEYARWWLTDQEDRLRVDAAQSYQQIDPLEDELREVLIDQLSVTNNQLLEMLNIEPAKSRAIWNRLHPLLTRMGWARYRTSTSRGWKPPPTR